MKRIRAAVISSGKRPAGKGRALKMRRILVPMDFSGQSRRALDFAVPLAREHGGKILLLHVVEPVYPVAAYPAEMSAIPVNPRPRIKPSKAKLSALAQKLVPPELLERTIVRTGRPHLEITAAARELK